MLPFASRSWMVIVDVADPSAVTLVGEVTMVDCDGETACAIVTVRSVVTVPDVARIVRVPFETAVTRPVATPDVATLATVASPSTIDHVTVGLEIGWLAALNTVALTVRVCPMDVSVCVVPGDSVMLAEAFETMTVTESRIAAFDPLTARTFVVPGALAVIVPSRSSRAR